MNKLVPLGIIGLSVIAASGVNADATVVQMESIVMLGKGSVSETKAIYYLSNGVQRVDTCHGLHAPPNTTAIFDRTRRRRISINWKKHLYYLDAWNPGASSEPGHGHAAGKYKVICGHKVSLYTTSTIIGGNKATITEWVAKDLPIDIRSGSPGSDVGMTLESVVHYATFVDRVTTRSVTAGHLPRTTFAPKLNGLKRVKDLAKIFEF